MRSTLNCGNYFRPQIAVEFHSTIAAIGYKPLRLPPPDLVGDAKKRKVMEDYQAGLKQQPFRFISTEQARAILGPHGFAHFFATPEGQELQRRENMEFERQFHGR